jgi:hypothetical protein
MSRREEAMSVRIVDDEQTKRSPRHPDASFSFRSACRICGVTSPGQCAAACLRGAALHLSAQGPEHNPRYFSDRLLLLGRAII